MCKSWLLVTAHYFQVFLYVMKFETKLRMLFDQNCWPKVSSTWSLDFTKNIFWSGNCIMSFTKLITSELHLHKLCGCWQLNREVCTQVSVSKKVHATTIMASSIASSICFNMSNCRSFKFWFWCVKILLSKNFGQGVESVPLWSIHISRQNLLEVECIDGKSSRSPFPTAINFYVFTL